MCCSTLLISSYLFLSILCLIQVFEYYNTFITISFLYDSRASTIHKNLQKMNDLKTKLLLEAVSSLLLF